MVGSGVMKVGGTVMVSDGVTNVSGGVTPPKIWLAPALAVPSTQSTSRSGTIR
jgi:hypothetical protein